MINLKTPLSWLFGGSILGSLLAAAPLSYASDDISDRFHLAGFATLAYAKVVSDTEEGTLNRFDNSGNYHDLNRFGLRLDVDLAENLDFVAQILAKTDVEEFDNANGSKSFKSDGNYAINFDWIAATYHFSPNLSITAGKTKSPLYMYSDFVDTSYAMPWLEAPFAAYGVGGVESNEGLTLKWLANFGGAWSSQLTIWGGRASDEVPELRGESIVVDNALGAAWEVDREWLTLRAVYLEGKSSAPLPQLQTFDTMLSAGINAGLGKALTDINPGLALATPVQLSSLNSYSLAEFEDEDSYFAGIGVNLDFESVFVTAEATRSSVDDNIAVSELNSWYTAVGFRANNDWTFTLTYSEDKDKPNKKIAEKLAQEVIDTHISTPTLAGALGAAGLAQLEAQALASVTTSINDAIISNQERKRKTLTLSTRWDFHPSASVKLEYTVARTEFTELNGSTFVEKDTMPRLIRVGMDLVF